MPVWNAIKLVRFLHWFCTDPHTKVWTSSLDLDLFRPFSYLSDTYIFIWIHSLYIYKNAIYRYTKFKYIHVLNVYLSIHTYLLLKTEALTNLYTNKWRATWVTGFSLYLLDNFHMFASSFKPCLHIITRDSKAHICR